MRVHPGWGLGKVADQLLDILCGKETSKMGDALFGDVGFPDVPEGRKDCSAHR